MVYVDVYYAHYFLRKVQQIKYNQNKGFSAAKHMSRVKHSCNRYLQNNTNMVNYTIYDEDLHLEIRNNVHVYCTVCKNSVL